MSPEQDCHIISSSEERPGPNEQEDQSGEGPGGRGGSPDCVASCLVGILKVIGVGEGVLYHIVAKLPLFIYNAGFLPFHGALRDLCGNS